MTKAVKDSDASTDRLLRRVLRAEAGAQATPECVDAETLGAWVDGALTREAIERVEQHASGCARCQALLASMARTAPDTTGRPWWQALTVRWVVPVAAAATALVLWVAVDRERTAPSSVPVSTAAADRAALPAAPEPVVRPGPVATPAPPEPSAADTQLAKRALDEAKAVQSPSSAPNRAGKPSAEVLADARREKALDAFAPKADAVSRSRAAAGGPAFMSTPPAAAPAPPAAPPPPSQPNAAPAGAAANAGAAPAVTPPPVGGVAEAVRTADIQKRGAPGARADEAIRYVDIASPEPSFRWRLVAPATIQRSTDGGATWTAESTRAQGLGLLQRDGLQPPIVLTAGSAPARDICWIVGRGGTVLLSTDGTSWQRRPFPEPVNLTAVRATDARTAVVTTEDGRQFSTADGGATWSKIP